MNVNLFILFALKWLIFEILVLFIEKCSRFSVLPFLLYLFYRHFKKRMQIFKVCEF